MALSKKLLGKNERVILHMHEHIKTLIPNFIGALLVIALAIVAGVMLPESWRPASIWIMMILALLLLVVVLFVPWLKWYTATYTVTNRRIITRRGIFTKSGHDIPLSRISDVSYQKDLLDRLFGCGTLILQTSADDPLLLQDIPNVEHVHVVMTEMLFGMDSTPNDLRPTHDELAAPQEPNTSPYGGGLIPDDGGSTSRIAEPEN
ncbi:MAG: PH domain-containing protein [Actinomycetaceae bacterium]|nr:PH domain-containing protein [Actinomycetaceae bacterium]